MDLKIILGTVRLIKGKASTVFSRVIARALHWWAGLVTFWNSCALFGKHKHSRHGSLGCSLLLSHSVAGRRKTMELKLEVLSSLPIKEKKPWPRLGWLQEVWDVLLTNLCFLKCPIVVVEGRARGYYKSPHKHRLSFGFYTQAPLRDLPGRCCAHLNFEYPLTWLLAIAIGSHNYYAFHTSNFWYPRNVG